MAMVWFTCLALFWSQASGQGFLADFFKSLEEAVPDGGSRAEDFAQPVQAVTQAVGSDPFNFASFFGPPSGRPTQVFEERVPEIVGSVQIARPILVNVGPFVDLDFGRGGMPDPFQAFFSNGLPFMDFGAMDREIQSMFNLLESQSAGSERSGGFHVETQNGMFQLRASLPGYNMQIDSAPEEKQPLSVEVLGKSLVVQGQRTEGDMIRSFQRSFRLPRAVDCGGITVTYNVSDGALAVDIPAKAGSLTNENDEDDEEEVWTMNTMEGGSQTSVMFSSGCHHGAPQLHEERPPIAARSGEDQDSHHSNSKKFLDPASQQSPHVASQDPLADLLETIFGLAPTNEPTEKPAQLAAAPLVKQREPTAESPTKAPPVVVQSKDAKPFWRLVTDEGGTVKNIEVVLPDGVEVGTPEGDRVPVFRSLKAQDAYASMRTPIGQVELPVPVHEEDCAIIDKSDSVTERMLSCSIAGETVRRVPIRVIDDEL